MKERRGSRLLVEPPSSATGDIAFNLIVFFLVCASVQPDAGREQQLPRADEKEQQKDDDKNIEVLITRNTNTVALNGSPVRIQDFQRRIAARLRGKKRPEDRVVVVQSKPDTEYTHWIHVTSLIEDAGGIVTLQMEEEQQVQIE